MKKYIYLIILLIIVSLGWLYYRYTSNQTPDVVLPPAVNYNDFKSNQNSNANTNTNQATNTNTDVNANINTNEVVVNQNVNTNQNPPSNQNEANQNSADEPVEQASLNLDVPFTSQAPTANWEQPFADACEEAAILMADYYLTGQAMPSAQEVERILTEMVNWQDSNMTGEVDMNISEVAYFVENYLGHKNYEIVEDLTVEKIKSYLNQGLPMIIPANGKRLANPNFRNGGPDYHMLIIKGYTDGHFITNDPGTRNGHDFVYTHENLMYSIADWNKKEAQANGPMRGLVLYQD